MTYFDYFVKNLRDILPLCMVRENNLRLFRSKKREHEEDQVKNLEGVRNQKLFKSSTRMSLEVEEFKHLWIF